VADDVHPVDGPGRSEAAAHLVAEALVESMVAGSPGLGEGEADRDQLVLYQLSHSALPAMAVSSARVYDMLERAANGEMYWG